MFTLGPNWHFEPQATDAPGLRVWRILREDDRGTIPVAYVRELPATGALRSTRFVATDLDGSPLGPPHSTGPRGAPLDDVRRHKAN